MNSAHDSLHLKLKTLKLPSFRNNYEDVARTAEKNGWTFPQYLHHLAELEIEDRRRRRIERNLGRSGLPREKTLATFDTARLARKLNRQVTQLCEGGFVNRAQNVLAFGLPGRGKTHLLCAICHELLNNGYSVLFVPTFKLVQQLLVAKRDLVLERKLKALDKYDVILLDDIGYVQQDRDEMEVLFTFLAERYERQSVMITSNLVFSQWDKIFQDPMTTAAAIDRLVHHAVILELTCDSYRSDKARERNATTTTTEAVDS